MPPITIISIWMNLDSSNLNPGEFLEESSTMPYPVRCQLGSFTLWPAPLFQRIIDEEAWHHNPAEYQDGSQRNQYQDQTCSPWPWFT